MIDEAHELMMISELPHGSVRYIVLPEESGAEIYRIHEAFHVYELKQYGGSAVFANTFFIKGNNKDECVANIINLIKSWT